MEMCIRQKTRSTRNGLYKEKIYVFFNLNLVNIQRTFKQIITLFIRFIIPMKVNT